MENKRDEYVEKVKDQLDRWNSVIDDLEAKKSQVTNAAREQYETRLEEAKARRDELQDKLAELKHSSDAAWEELKSGIDLAWDSLSSALKSAKQKFEE